jgi:NADPH-dependent 2,4-dienoyl-CoA reductase/sulfur reductase-like enzyme/rhodanese-related sulfurtransferase
MNIVIVGGVAGGATAAARARRQSESANIIVLEKGPYVSFANCGLPYAVGGEISKRSKLLLQSPESFKARYNIDVRVQSEALSIDRESKTLQVKGPEGEYGLPYDKLILAQGGRPYKPGMPGIEADHVFTLWTVPEMDLIQEYIQEKAVKNAVVIGAGFIGLEMAEALKHRGIGVTVLELGASPLPIMDFEYGAMIQDSLEAHGVRVLTSTGAKAILAEEKKVELSTGELIDADMVLVSVGVRPQLDLAKAAGLEIGEAGGLRVNQYLQSSDPDIYAAGDMIEVQHAITGKTIRMPLAGPANRQGRIAGANAAGQRQKYGQVLGSSIVKVFDKNAASTGLTEKAAKDAGFDVGAVIIPKGNHAGYYPGASELVLKLVFEKSTGKLLGAQAFGGEGVDKRIDSFAVALKAGWTVEELAEMDFAYAPPFNSANDHLNMAAFVAQGSLEDYNGIYSPMAFWENYSSGQDQLIDVRTAGEHQRGRLDDAVLIPVDELREADLSGLDPKKTTWIYCYAGYRGHLATRILKQKGFTDVRNISGGWNILQHYQGKLAKVTTA